MKNKVVAGVLALMFGVFGVHRFYLGQTGLGIAYLLFFWTGIPALIAFVDAIVLLSMGKQDFDHKYNWKYLDNRYRDLDSDFERRRYEELRRRESQKQSQRDVRYSDTRRAEKPRPTPPPRPKKVHNPFKESGVKKFKEYEFDGAIEDFEQALEVDEKDIAVHFNLACAYSITEKKEEAFYHLDRSVLHGFKDFKRIDTHDALAYLRIQDEFDEFKNNSYRLASNAGEITEKVNENHNLLEQLQKLADLREKGLLTEEEFSIQKKRLLG